MYLPDKIVFVVNLETRNQTLFECVGEQYQELISAAKAGQISYRQTFLGGCANSGPPCPLGGISNISSCMGFGKKSMYICVIG
jgi:hypothetical protein